MPITYFFLFYPFRMESELNRRELLLYYAKLNEPCVIHVTNFKKCFTEVFSDLVDKRLCTLELICLPTLISMRNSKMIKQRNINLKVQFESD